MHARVFYCTAAAAERLSLSPRTLELYRRTGEGPAFHRFGSRVRYLDEDLDEWAAARRREGKARKGGEHRATAGQGRRKPPRRARDNVNGSRTAGDGGRVRQEPPRTMGGRKLKSGT